jgi:hypothetical protein
LTFQFGVQKTSALAALVLAKLLTQLSARQLHSFSLIQFKELIPGYLVLD